jgi:hypothetical protein
LGAAAIAAALCWGGESSGGGRRRNRSASSAGPFPLKSLATKGAVSEQGQPGSVAFPPPPRPLGRALPGSYLRILSRPISGKATPLTGTARIGFRRRSAPLALPRTVVGREGRGV